MNELIYSATELYAAKDVRAKIFSPSEFDQPVSERRKIGDHLARFGRKPYERSQFLWKLIGDSI